MPDTSPPQPAGLRATLRALVREIGKFGTVGAISFAIDLAIFNVLLEAGVESLTAKTVSTVLATTVAFTGNRFWTWRHRAHAHMARQYTMFVVLNAIGLGIGLTCLAISHYGLGQIWPALQSKLADNISGLLIGNGFGTLFRFWSYRRFVFPEQSSPPDVLPEQGSPPDVFPEQISPPDDARTENRKPGVTSPPSPLSDSA